MEAPWAASLIHEKIWHGRTLLSAKARGGHAGRRNSLSAKAVANGGKMWSGDRRVEMANRWFGGLATIGALMAETAETIESEYLAQLEHERHMFAWAVSRLGGVPSDQAEVMAERRYPYEPPSDKYRDLAFHNSAWHKAMLHLRGEMYWVKNRGLEKKPFAYEVEEERLRVRKLGFELERLPAQVFACLRPGELRITILPGLGSTDGDQLRDVPIEVVPLELRLPNTPLWIHLNEELNVARVWRRGE